MEKTKKCPKCDGSFTKGIIVDRYYVRHYSDTEWAESINNKLLKQDIKNRKKIASYRCESCGYLELYAN